MAPSARTAASLWLLLGFLASLAAAQIPNASFERLEAGRPLAWRTHDWAGEAGFAVSPIGRHGERSILLESGEAGCDSAWYVQLPVRANARYQLTGWIRTQNMEPIDGLGALLNLHGRPEHSQAVVGDSDWTQVRLEFETGWETSVQLNCIVGYHGRASGRAWFDDLKLELLEERPVEIADIHIDATKRGEPISPYIYGQFIEHLGRCIYGGIWAEMLEDRTFHFPITSTYQPWDEQNAWHLIASPWRLLGDAGGVVMQQDNDWAVWPVPELARGAGIEQRDLALENGREYTGRIVLDGMGQAGSVFVSLIWKEDRPRGSADVRLLDLDGSDGFVQHPLRFRSDGETGEGILRIVNAGPTPIRIAA
ncbi:MAG: hypothetical protein ACF8NJ_09285, partial [Phycisphaerales bacterium JB038]